MENKDIVDIQHVVEFPVIYSKKTIKSIIYSLYKEDYTFFNAKSEYMQGKMDAYTELCEKLGIKCTREPNCIMFE